MAWLTENITWIFSGIGVSVIGVLGYIFRKKLFNSGDSKNENTNTMTNNVTINNNVSTLPQGEMANSRSCRDKASTNILFIDDQKFDHVKILKKAGWSNTRRIKDVMNTDCEDIKWAHVVFVDVNGVGVMLYPKEQGFGVAASIKRKYPNKYVVVYSASPQHLNDLINEVDAVLPKDADPYQYIIILENWINDGK